MASHISCCHSKFFEPKLRSRIIPRDCSSRKCLLVPIQPLFSRGLPVKGHHQTPTSETGFYHWDEFVYVWNNFYLRADRQ